MTQSSRSTKRAVKTFAKKPSSRLQAQDPQTAFLAAIDAMPATDRILAEGIDAIVRAAAPALAPKLWYGMPGYARNGKIVCFFQSAHKFKTRYATLGFMHEANLDDGPMWPTAFALKEITPAEETKIIALVKKAAG